MKIFADLTEETNEERRVALLHIVLDNEVHHLLVITVLKLKLNDHFRHMWE